MMQQTETYKLNKPESTDTFSVGPLNENADKIETALAALDGAAADLQSRVTALEVHKIVAGTYQGSGEGNHIIPLGLTPKAAFIHSLYVTSGESTVMAVEGGPSESGSAPHLEIVEGGLKVGYQFNRSSFSYYFLALA